MRFGLRWLYLLLVLMTIFAGLATRRYSAYLPAWFAEYGGDALWGLMVYWLFGLLFSGQPFSIGVLSRSTLSLIFAFGIEISQLYHAPWIDNIRGTKLGGLVMGFGFLWSDLACYAIGVFLGLATEKLFSRVLDELNDE